MAYPSHVARDALRRALRTALQESGEGHLFGGKPVNSLALDDLKNALAVRGVNPDAIVTAALAAPAPAPLRVNQSETKTMEIEELTAPVADAIEEEVQSLRSLVVTGGFAALDDRLRELVIEARKPAVEILVPAAPLVPGATIPVHVSRPTGRTETWRALFGVKGDLGRREVALWDGTHPDTPMVNQHYLWPQPATAIALSESEAGYNVMLFGPAGTGKTEFPQQLAARTGRPFALISCDTGTDASTLVGMTVPHASGGVTWQDGQLTRAIKTPGCVICLDEPSVARPGALFVLQNVLEHRQLFIAETGLKVPVAAGVSFWTTDNTNGTGGGARRGYTDTNRLNAAFLDRWSVRVRIDYMPKDREAKVLVAYTGCTPELADLLISAAAVTRAAADDQTLSHGIGLRRLRAWARLLMNGIDPEAAFQCAVLNCASEQDVETLREQCLLAYDRDAVAAAINPPAPVPVPPELTNPSPEGRAAAREFNVYQGS